MNASFDVVERAEAFRNTILFGFSPDTIVWSIFYILLVIFIIYSILLLYHWLRYGSVYAFTWVMMIAYFAVSFVLLSTMLTTAITLT